MNEEIMNDVTVETQETDTPAETEGTASAGAVCASAIGTLLVAFAGPLLVGFGTMAGVGLGWNLFFDEEKKEERKERRAERKAKREAKKALKKKPHVVKDDEVEMTVEFDEETIE